MIFNGLVVDMRMESATFGCAAVDYGEVSLGADRKMVAAGVAAIPIRIKTAIAVMGLASITAIIMGCSLPRPLVAASAWRRVAAGCGAAPTCSRPCISPCWLRW